MLSTLLTISRHSVFAEKVDSFRIPMTILSASSSGIVRRYLLPRNFVAYCTIAAKLVSYSEGLNNFCERPNAVASWTIQGSETLYNGPAVRWRRESPGTTVCIRDAFYNASPGPPGFRLYPHFNSFLSAVFHIQPQCGHWTRYAMKLKHLHLSFPMLDLHWRTPTVSKTKKICF
jgi:hypothetical protein